MSTHAVTTKGGTELTDPGIARMLFNDTRFSWIWLIVRIVVGWPWLTAGWAKLNEAGWLDGGAALKGFWEHVLSLDSTGAPLAKVTPLTYDWYSSFLKALYDAHAWTWFAPLVAIGEFVVGIAIIIGLFTAIAAFFGSFMNWNYVMAGVASSNMFLFSFAILLILAWKTAGWLGVDRFLLPLLGTPWTNRGAAKPASPGAATATTGD